MAASAANVDDIVFERSETLRWYSHQPKVEYGFCSRCGSSLFWRSADAEGSMSITAGSLDHPTGLSTVASLFDAHAGDYFDLPKTADSHPGDRS